MCWLEAPSLPALYPAVYLSPLVPTLNLTKFISRVITRITRPYINPPKWIHA